ncbi:AraC family transcriptional regulator [Gemmatimonadetes bacterium T265]|nr:AraC family transcriptional regulator [Gemmatimonadetes bacterium T265]
MAILPSFVEIAPRRGRFASRPTPATARQMLTIAVLALDGVMPFELGMPCEVFGRTAVPGVADPYRVRVCAERRAVRAGAVDLRVRWGLHDLVDADTVVVPGGYDPEAPVPDAVYGALRRAADRGARVVSLCLGAFVLAAAGLLDGRRATTHWRAARLLAERYPAVTVDPDVLFVDEGQILTSAGAAAWLDLCLHLVRRDYGAAVAADAARLTVMPLAREGGQAQFIARQDPASDVALEPLLAWLAAHLDRRLSLPQIARRAGMSPRTLARQFRAQTGTTPLQWLLTARVRRAQALLETTALSVEQVAARAGFESAAALRHRFARVTGTSPVAYRRAFGGGARLTGGNAGTDSGAPRRSPPEAGGSPGRDAPAFAIPSRV